MSSWSQRKFIPTASCFSHYPTVSLLKVRTVPVKTHTNTHPRNHDKLSRLKQIFNHLPSFYQVKLNCATKCHVWMMNRKKTYLLANIPLWLVVI